MPYFLGIDTSNYTTSVAVYNSENNEVLSAKKLLPVKSGELGLRQSDAVFAHIKQFWDVFSHIPQEYLKDISAVGVSVRPCDAEGSYMPCFITGKTIAESIAYSKKLPIFYFSHQAGHIMAALYSAKKNELLKNSFLAFHISGGTSELVKVEHSRETVFRCNIIGKSLDLKIGQAVDRLGKLFDMPFPSGKCLDDLSLSGVNNLKFPKKLIDSNCSISGFENKFNEYIKKGYKREDIACSLFNSIADILIKMAKTSRENEGDLPVVFSGGVMANTIIRNRIMKELPDCSFAEPQYSSDNAAGISVLTYLKSVGEI